MRWALSWPLIGSVVLVFAAPKGVSVYAIRAEKVKKEEASVDPSIAHLKKALAALGGEYNRFELLGASEMKAEEGQKAVLTVEEAKLQIRCTVEKAGRRVQVRMRLVQVVKKKEKVLLDTRYLLKDKPLVVVGVRLKRGRLVVVLALR